MTKPPAITYKVFLFERVKNKTIFFNTATYPLQIRLTAGTRTTCIKSHFFSLLQHPKYRRSMQGKDASFILKEIILLEEDVMNYLLRNCQAAAAPGAIRDQYTCLSADLLQELDKGFKQFLVKFFYSRDLPAYAMLIESEGHNHQGHFILNTLEKSLRPELYNQLLTMAAAESPPFIPLLHFYQAHMHHSLPVMPVFFWKRDQLYAAFSRFCEEYFPEYKNPAPAQYIQQLVDRITPAGNTP